MSAQKLKQGYMKKFSKGIVGESWKKVYVELYKDGLFCWYKKKKKGSSRKGSILLPNICEFFTIGSYCRAIPFSPGLPSGGRLDFMIAFPEEPNKKSKIHFFLCDSEQEFGDWMNAITSTFPPAPVQQQQQPSHQPSPSHSMQNMTGVGPYNAYSPSSSAAAAAAPAPPPCAASPCLGFEGLSISSNPPPYAPYPPSTSASSYQPFPGQPYPPQPYPQQAYPPQQPYPQQPYPQQQYPQQQYPQQQYPQQQYPQQQYPQQPYRQQYPQYQPYGGPSYPVQTVPQTVYVHDHRSRNTGGMGKMAAGVLGGAVAGYAASRMFGGWGHGFGWGHGSWGSCSWGSGSWGSCSGGSWGSFGSFD